MQSEAQTVAKHLADALDRSSLMIPVGAGEIPSVQTAIAPD